MPELPEVETMVRGLRPALVGRTVRAIEACDAHVLQGVTAKELARRCAGAGVSEVFRRGKWVAIALESGRGFIVIQPRMTGGFRLVPPERPEHVRLIFRTDGTPGTVWFCDVRRLGRIAWYADTPAAEAAFSRSQGPDALVIAHDELAARLKRIGRGIKAALMDQKVLAGIGNIYADEICHRAGVHPTRPASRLKAEELARIHAAIRPLLEEAILAEGSSFDAGYRTVLGVEGGFLASSSVHRRAGKPCRSCSTAIVKTRIVGLIGRPTYFCPTCQPAGRRRSGSPVRSRGDRLS